MNLETATKEELKAAGFEETATGTFSKDMVIVKFRINSRQIVTYTKNSRTEKIIYY